MSDFSDWEVIDTYSTKQAVEDGFLVRVDWKISKEAGIKYPVYLTRAVWDKYVEIPEGFEGVQDLDGRLWDVLFMFMFAARACNQATLMYKLNVVLADKGDWSQMRNWILIWMVTGICGWSHLKELFRHRILTIRHRPFLS